MIPAAQKKLTFAAHVHSPAGAAVGQAVSLVTAERSVVRVIIDRLRADMADAVEAITRLTG